MRRVYKNLCPDMISASIMVANMRKNSLKNAESDKNKVLFETLIDFLQRNGTCFLNNPRINVLTKLINHVFSFILKIGSCRHFSTSD